MVHNHDPRDGILLAHVKKSYGPVQAVRGVNLAITPGETVALLGPNGAGKSTTIDMILGRPGTCRGDDRTRHLSLYTP
jgi:ABC-2 type transport system ATP-binding protein